MSDTDEPTEPLDAQPGDAPESTPADGPDDGMTIEPVDDNAAPAEGGDMKVEEAAPEPPAEGAKSRFRKGTSKLRPGTAIRKKASETGQEGEPATGSVFVPPPAKPSTIKKIVFFSIPLLIIGAAVGGFFVKDANGFNVWKLWAMKLGLATDTRPAPKPHETPIPERKPLDKKYDEAAVVRNRGQFYITNEVNSLKSTPEKQTLEKILDVLKELERLDIQISGFINGPLAELGAAVEENPITKTDFDNLKYHEEFKTFTEFRRGLLAQIKDLKDLHRQKGGQPKEPELPPAPTLNKKWLHPYGRFVDGFWIRHKVSVANAPGETPSVEYVDTGLKSGGKPEDTQAVVITERHANGTTQPAAEHTEPWEAEGLTVGAVEALQIDATPMRCTVVQAGETKLWVAAEGDGSGWLIVKRTGPQGEFTATSIAKEQVTLGGRTENCFRIAGQSVEGGATFELCTWISPGLYGCVFKLEKSGNGRTELHEFVKAGTSWERRTEFPVDAPPPPKEEPPKDPMAGVQDPPKEDPKPDPPKEDPPKPEVKRVRLPSPWASIMSGTWYRTRTVSKAGATTTESYADTGLKEAADTHVITLAQAPGTEAAEHRQDIPEATVIGEESLSVGGREIPCLVTQSEAGGTTTRTWSMMEGGNPASVWLKLETTSDGTTTRMTVTKVSEDKLDFKGDGHEVKVVEGESDGPQGKGSFKMWISDRIGLGVLKSEMKWPGLEMATEIVEAGDDWEKRPPFPEPAAKTAPPKEDPKTEPPPKAEPRVEPKPEPPPKKPVAPFIDEKSERVKKGLEEAAALIKSATPLFREVAAADPLPSEVAALQALLGKAEEARKHLEAAGTRYSDVKKDSANPETVQQRLQAIEGLLDKLKEYIRRIRARLS